MKTLNLTRPLDEGPVVVHTKGLAKSFGPQKALDGLDLSVPKGAVYVLVGPNGAGKTTTLRTLVDLVRADGGHAEVFGRSPVTQGPYVRARIGYVPEAHDFGYTRLRVGELFAHHASYFQAWDTEYADRLIRDFEISTTARFGKLSKGQSRRVQLAMALGHRPELLLLDEPTDGLDPLARDQVLSLLAEHVASTPTTVLVSTHLIHELEGLGDHLGALRNGRLIAQLRRDELESRLHRIRADVPEGWEAPQEIRELSVHCKESDREFDWVMWGHREDLQRRLESAGATVRHASGLTLEEATRALLRMEEGR